LNASKSAIQMVLFQRNEVEIWSFRLRPDQKPVLCASARLKIWVQ